MAAFKKHGDDDEKEALIEACKALGLYLDRMAAGERVESI
jgi:hypothetical protein